MQMVRNLGPEFTRSFGAIYPEIAHASELILIPFFLEGVAGRSDLNQADGIHPTADGYRIIVDHIQPYIVQAIESHRQKLNQRRLICDRAGSERMGAWQPFHPKRE